MDDPIREKAKRILREMYNQAGKDPTPLENIDDAVGIAPETREYESIVFNLEQRLGWVEKVEELGTATFYRITPDGLEELCEEGTL